MVLSPVTVHNPFDYFNTQLPFNGSQYSSVVMLPKKTKHKLQSPITFILPSEYQICLWCATEVATARWACTECRNLIKHDLHAQEVSAHTLTGQFIMDECRSFPGSLSVQEMRYAVSPTLQTRALELIKILPLDAPEYPFDLPPPNDLLVRVLGSRVNIIVSGSKQMQLESHLSKEQAARLHNAIILAIYKMREEPFTHSQNLFVDSMAQLVL